MHPRNVNQIAQMRAERMVIWGKVDKQPSAWTQDAHGFGQHCFRLCDVFHRVVHDNCIDAAVGKGKRRGVGADKSEFIGQAELFRQGVRFGAVFFEDLHADDLFCAARGVIQ